MKIIASSLFIKYKKKSYPKLQKTIDEQVQYIYDNPLSGDMKKGNLQNIRVHKFKFENQLYLLSYEIVNENLHLYSIGNHENFYKNLGKVTR